jgi:spore coat protein U-like protein
VSVSISTANNTRSMQGPRRSLAYQLYVDAARTQIWGDGTSGTSPITGTLTVASNGSVTQSFYVYGRVAGGQNSAEAGSYLDTLVVTLGW